MGWRIRAQICVQEHSLDGRCSGDSGEVACLPGVSACGPRRTHRGVTEHVTWPKSAESPASGNASRDTRRVWYAHRHAPACAGSACPRVPVGPKDAAALSPVGVRCLAVLQRDCPGRGWVGRSGDCPAGARHGCQPEASARSSGAVAHCVASPSAGWCILASQWARVVGAFTWWPLHSSLEKRWNLPDFLKARPKAGTALPLPDPCVGVWHKARLFSGGGECGSAPHNEKKLMAATFGGYQLQCTCEFYFIICFFKLLPSGLWTILG